MMADSNGIFIYITTVIVGREATCDMRNGVIRFWRSLSTGGILLGTLFFAASLTPTLVPRTYLTQGVLSGACFAGGYGIGVAWQWLWAYMELPEPRERILLALKIAVTAICAVVAIMFLSWTAGWQNSIRQLMQLEPVTSAHPLEVCLIAIVTFLVLIALARLFKRISRLDFRKVGSLRPPQGFEGDRFRCRDTVVLGDRKWRTRPLRAPRGRFVLRGV